MTKERCHRCGAVKRNRDKKPPPKDIRLAVKALQTVKKSKPG